MPWTDKGGWRDHWLPLSDTSRNVEEQRAGPVSTLHFTRELISLRREIPALRSARYEEISAPEGAWAWRRGDGVQVALNLGSEPAAVRTIDGWIALSTGRTRDGEPVAESLVLAPSEGAIVVATR